MELTPTPSLSATQPPVTTSITMPLTPGLPLPDCWTSKECTSTFNLFQNCFNTIGGIGDPNNEIVSAEFQACLCDVTNIGNLQENNQTWSPCATCLVAASVTSTVISGLSDNIHGLCGTDHPNTYLFLVNVLDFLKRARAPSGWGLTEAATRFTTLSARFRSTSGMNEFDGVMASASIMPGFPITTLGEPESSSSSTPDATATAVATTSVRSGSGSGSPTPTIAWADVSALLPSNWPYDGAPPRKQGQRMSTTVSRNGTAVAVVVTPETVGWWGLPLDRRPVEMAPLKGQQEGAKHEEIGEVEDVKYGDGLQRPQKGMKEGVNTGAKVIEGGGGDERMGGEKADEE